ncbi:MAG: hypothetical protein IIC67_01120 [Thaumarchaeota archaeon]|nr:hypothetical protein [Nitrososphaerota archaeon]
MSMEKDYRKSILTIISLTVLTILFFNPIITSAESDSNRPPMTLDWKLNDVSDGTYWSPQGGDKILVYGTINAGYDSTFEIGEIQTDVSLVLSDPTREIIRIGQAEPTCVYDQCYFEWTIAVGSLWKYTGQYEIQACYFGHNNPQGQCASTEIPYVKAVATTPPLILIPSDISVWSDKSSYTEGDIIKISGKVTNPNSVSKVSIILKAPNGNLVSVSQHNLSYDNTFSTTLTAGGALMNVSGTYRFVVQYGSENISDSGSFYYSAPVVKPTPTQTTIISVEVSGLSHYVEYRISGGKLLSIIPDMDANSLILSIDSSGDGSISVELPRKLIDAKMRNGDDDQFFVLVDGNEATSNEKTTSSTRIITIEFSAGAEELEIIGTIVGTEQPTYTPPTTTLGTISVSTDDFEYSPSDLVTVTISASKSAIVAISVIGPGGDSIVSRSVTTDYMGSGSLQFKLPESSQNGSYRVDSTATISGSKVSDSTTFTVKSTSARVDIISLQPTDQQGNTVSTFTKGKLGFVKVILSSDASVNSLVTINLFDSDLTSLGIGSFKTTLGSGQSEMTLSFFIPNYADLGNGDIYANIFSDWPSQGGVPLTGESSTQVRIQ